MEAQLEQIRDQQKDTWNKFSAGWKKWDEMTMNFLRPMGDEIIRQLQLTEKDVVLDIAGGTGEPAVSFATIVTRGKVICTHPAEGMLQTAQEKVAAHGITNMETQVCDVSQLPFADNTFDVGSCRFGFLFFPGLQFAANEKVRIFKPGGRLATSVLYPQKTPG